MANLKAGMISVSLKNLFRGSVALLGLGAGAAALADFGLYGEDLSPQDEEAQERIKLMLHEQLPSRAERVEQMLEGTQHNPFDIFIIGGGATGTGCAVDAVTRCSSQYLSCTW